MLCSEHFYRERGEERPCCHPLPSPASGAEAMQPALPQLREGKRRSQTARQADREQPSRLALQSVLVPNHFSTSCSEAHLQGRYPRVQVPRALPAAGTAEGCWRVHSMGRHGCLPGEGPPSSSTCQHSSNRPPPPKSCLFVFLVAVAGFCW